MTGTVTGSFSYDDELRLTQSITDTGSCIGRDTETFTLDTVGNRSAHSRVLGPWNYDANNRLTDKGMLIDAASYDYDESGNLTRKTKGGKATQYRYDTQNRLIEVKDGSDNLIARYGYDPLTGASGRNSTGTKTVMAWLKPSAAITCMPTRG